MLVGLRQPDRFLRRDKPLKQQQNVTQMQPCLKVSCSTAELWAQKADAIRDIAAKSAPDELPERDWNIRLGETRSPVNIPITRSAGHSAGLAAARAVLWVSAAITLCAVIFLAAQEGIILSAAGAVMLGVLAVAAIATAYVIIDDYRSGECWWDE